MGDISKNFSRTEFACKCSCGFDTVDVALVAALETIREHFGKRITVSSGNRCPAHNASVGGSVWSQHKKSRAADIVVKSTNPAVVAEFAESLGLSVGRYSTFTHVDTRTGPPALWG